MRILSLIASLLLMGACSSTPDLVRSATEPVPTVTVFQNVDVFAGLTTQVTRDVDVWVHGDTIRHIGPTGVRAIPPTAAIVEGAGLTLLPGLIDLHTHMLSGASPPWKLSLPNPERNLQTFLWAGITTVVDLGGHLEKSVKLRDEVAAGKVLGPRMLVSGPHFTAPGGHPAAMLDVMLPWYLRWLVSDEEMAFQVTGESEARDGVARSVAAGVDVIKMTSDTIPLDVPRIEPSTAEAVAAAARAHGKLVFAHVGTNDDAMRMAEAGANILAHGIYRERLEETTARVLAEKGIAVVPTMTVFDAVDRLVHDGLEEDAIQQGVRDPKVWKALTNRPPRYTLPERFVPYLDEVHASRPHWVENVRRLREAGVTILAGSDSPTLGSFGGAALHRELRLLQDAGMTPAEVLQAATLENARAIRRDGEVGSIEAGKKADLLLVEGDPTIDLANLHRIRAVYLGGKAIER